jgi:CRP-like cAMP-binding protein
MFIFLSGFADVYTGTADKVKAGVLSAGSVSGELAMLGVARHRNAHVIASTFISAWEVGSVAGLRIIQDFPQIQNHFREQVKRSVEAQIVTCIHSLHIFRRFTPEFRLRFALFCERRVFFPNEKVLREGTQSPGLVIICKGEARLERGGSAVKSLSNGDHTDALVMLGVHERCHFTITVERTCHVLVLSRQSYLQVHESCEGLREAAQMLKQEELLRFEELKSQEARTARNREQEKTMMNAKQFAQGGQNPAKNASATVRTQIQKELEKSGGVGAGLLFDHWENQFSTLSIKATLKNVISSWAAWTRRSVIKQRARLQQNYDIDQFKERHVVARAERERRKKEKRAISARCVRLPCMPRVNTPRNSSPRRMPRGQAPTSSTKFEELSSMYLQDGRGWEALLPLVSPSAPGDLARGGSRGRAGEVIAGTLKLSQFG